MDIDNWLLLNRLKKAVKKISFLLNFNVHRWRIASMIDASPRNRRLSFNDRPGLRACCADETDSGSESGSSRGLQRTISYPSEDDVDKRADKFIANFYRQLRIERQVSLELRYSQGNSAGFDSMSPTSERKTSPLGAEVLLGK